MSVSQRLDMRQSQQLVMTPQLQQAIKMLQMSNLELRDFICEELERNPLLETRDQGAEDGGSENGRDNRRDEPAEAPGAAPLEVELSQDRLGRADETFDTGVENLYADEAAADRMEAGARAADAMGCEGPGGAPCADGAGPANGLDAGSWSSVGKGGNGRFDDPEQSWEAALGGDVTLREHLLEQLGQAEADPTIRLIAADLIDNMDPDGYLRAEFDETASRLGADHDAVERAASVIRGFEPTGVGARDLKECLAQQLAERDRLDPAMAALLEHLPLLANREFAKLQKLCGVDLDDLREMVAEIRSLDPKPGLRFDAGVAQTVIPDVFVYENRQGGWTVELNTETLPRLILNNAYAADVARAANGHLHEVKEYLAERQQSANWLLKSIDQRAKTILRVASEIVRQQDGFLAIGVHALRPLNLKSVADAIEMHESTVSRVTSNKYIATPRGVFELKYFFTPAIASTEGGEGFSAEAIRHRIKSLIDRETGDDVLSDDRIVAILRDAGVDIARRTVAKYREALKIPSSVQRRKLKAAEAVI